MKILGINDYSHDISVALVVNGKIIYAVEEERLSGIKHHKGFMYGQGFPEKSLNEIMKRTDLHMEDIDLFAFGWNLNKKRTVDNANKIGQAKN